ncbi:hypothetical protein P4O66_006122 [Electrophorus voltai]|uniref:Uncharacterized protein n=1 Tax=Electrophorus voltai TaxID=2609070 RepID=A0AAD9E2F0_9TELE|nr:hypothetical protein P4O66_006122 [Electrophorus voltai]
MWESIRDITNCRKTSPSCDIDASLPEKSILLQNDQVLCLTVADVRSPRCHIHTYHEGYATYRSNRSAEDTISTTLQLALTYLDKKGTYVRLMFSIQHHRSSEPDWKVELTGLEHFRLQLDTGFLDW